MNVVAPRTLRAFWNRHPQAEQPLKAWQKRIQNRHYANWAELTRDFPRADYIGNRRLIVFDIGGNKYRLVVFIRYEAQTLFIKYVMTHGEYDEWNKGGRQ